jgi:hypothetical protein
MERQYDLVVVGWFNTLRVGETVSAFKVPIGEDTGRILGAHLLGPHADEVISLFSLAIRLGIPADGLKQALFAYPTSSWDTPLHALSRRRPPAAGAHARTTPLVDRAVTISRLPQSVRRLSPPL